MIFHFFRFLEIATADQEEDDQDLDSIIDAFKDACAKQNIEPIPSVLEQIKVNIFFFL